MKSVLRHAAMSAVTGAVLLHAVDASAILVRKNYEFNSEFERYVNLGNQARFDTVGGLSLVVPQLGAMEVGYCTGSLITANVVLTAAHCFHTSEGRLYEPSGSLFEGGFSRGVYVTFAGGRSVIWPRTYLGVADRVSVYPGYSGTYESGDIALVRIGSMSAGAPTNYLSINTTLGEAQPTPAFSVIAGYGMLGNGVDGPRDNTAKVKLGALTTIQDVPAEPRLLKSTFLSPGQAFTAGYPSNFLQGAPGKGDSGGPMVRDVNGLQTIVGTVGGGGSGTTLFEPRTSGDYYGQDNYWVRTASFSDWISQEATRLGGSAPLQVAGMSPLNPILSPVQTFAGQQGPYTQKSFAFLSSGGWVYVDPAAGDFDDIAVSQTGPLMTGIDLAAIDPAKLVQLQLFSENTQSYGAATELRGGEQFLFATPTSQIRLTGLNGEVVTLGFAFEQAGVVDMVWTSTTAVPEATTWLLMMLGLLGISVAGRRRRAACRGQD